MDLHKLFAKFEALGYTTLGQAKSALVTAGVYPESIAINHAELDKAILALKPAAVAAAGAGAAATAEKVAPGTGPVAGAIAGDVATLVLDRIGPGLEHILEGIEDRLQAKLEEHMSPVHAALTAAALPSQPAGT